MTFVVGTLEEAAAQWLAGNSLDGADDDFAITSRNGFDAVATCFTLDVLSDARLSLRALHQPPITSANTDATCATESRHVVHQQPSAQRPHDG